MSCPTCDYTMAWIGPNPPGYFFLCPRCGTLIDQSGPRTEVYVPALVGRCRAFREEIDKPTPSGLGARGYHQTLWESLGIREAIHKSEDRPQ